MIQGAHTHLGLGLYTLWKTEVNTGDPRLGGALYYCSKMPTMMDLKYRLLDQG